MFPLLCLTVKTHSGACGHVLLNTNTGSTTLDSRTTIKKKGSYEQFKTPMWPACPVRSHTSHIQVSVCITTLSYKSSEQRKTEKHESNSIFLPFQSKEQTTWPWCNSRKWAGHQIVVFQRDGVPVCVDTHFYSLQCLHRKKDDWWKWKIWNWTKKT